MTEEQHSRLVAIGDQFWVDFSRLCNDALAKCAKAGIDEDVAAPYLSDKTSFYGRKTSG